MKAYPWMPAQPIDVFFFDFDGTISSIEGIDVLAEMNGVGDEVKAITQRCMAVTGLSQDAYRQRLDAVLPSREQLIQLAELYKKHCTPGVRETIALLKALNKKIYIISAGIKASIVPLAWELGISSDDVFAVKVFFDEQGCYKNYDENSFLVHSQGKNKQIQNIIRPNQKSLLIGDGLSDWETHSIVSRFVGFAGENPKDWVRLHSDFFIASNTIYPLISLGLSYHEQKNLSVEHQVLNQLGMTLIHNGSVLIQGVAPCSP